MQGAGPVRGILDRMAAFPLADGRFVDAMLFGQGSLAQLGISCFLRYGGGDAGVCVKANLHHDEP